VSNFHFAASMDVPAGPSNSSDHTGFQVCAAAPPAKTNHRPQIVSSTARFDTFPPLRLPSSIVSVSCAWDLIACSYGSRTKSVRPCRSLGMFVGRDHPGGWVGEQLAH